MGFVKILSVNHGVLAEMSHPPHYLLRQKIICTFADVEEYHVSDAPTAEGRGHNNNVKFYF